PWSRTRNRKVVASRGSATERLRGQGTLGIARDAHQDELQRLGDCEPDLADELAGVELQRQNGIGGGADEVRLGRGGARERALREERAQQPADEQLDASADQAVVRLE